jgi:hypothetical protein
VLEECTTGEQRSVVCFFVGKRTQCNDIHKEMFYVYGGKCLSLKAVNSLVKQFSQKRSEVADDELEMRKWLRQQSKDFYAAGFDELIKRWDKCINVGGGYVEK